jgi:5-methylcytosine-specific restriction protein A
MPKRPCLDCSRLTANASRCNECGAAYAAKLNAKRGGSTARGYGYRWRKLALSVITEHRQSYGEQCPGYGVAPHPSSDLTVDHIIPKAVGGTDDRTNLRVLCRRCNSRKRDAR